MWIATSLRAALVSVDNLRQQRIRRRSRNETRPAIVQPDAHVMESESANRARM
jgi:hypothetical protein